MVRAPGLVMNVERMRVLFATGSSARYMRPPLLGTEQVNCGPDWQDSQDAAGRVTSLQTPVGDYDLGAIAAKLPPEQQPDVVVCLVDASWRNTPRNLQAFKCPRVLLIADTHHLRSPLIGMIRYFSSEPFDRAALLYDRHHAAFFHAAGFRDLAWLPGLTFPHDDAAVAAARTKGRRENRIGFVGQTGKFHPRRGRLLEALTAEKLPVVARPLPQGEALRFYGASAIGFNASLNGDLNLRVFEILASGAALLTDRLAVDSGLARILNNGTEVATYGDVRELATIAQDLIARPEVTGAMGQAGATWFDTHWNGVKRQAVFREFAFNGTVPEMFAFDQTERTRVFFGSDIDRLLQAVIVYEDLQETHRQQESVCVRIDDENVPAEVTALVATLPRVELKCKASPTRVDLAVCGHAEADASSSTAAMRVWCWDAEPEKFDSLAARFAPAGFTLANQDVALFCREAPRMEDEVAHARALFQQGCHRTAFDQAKGVLERDPRSAAARVLLGELALMREGAPLAEKLARDALRLLPGDDEAEVLLGRALVAQGRRRLGEKCIDRVLARTPQCEAARQARAQLQHGRGSSSPHGNNENDVANATTVMGAK